MNKQTIINTVFKIFKTELGDDNLELSLDSTPSSIEKWDSINNLSIINAIEERFEVTFSIDDIFNIEKVDDFCDFILKNITN